MVLVNVAADSEHRMACAHQEGIQRRDCVDVKWFWHLVGEIVMMMLLMPLQC
jgi:hypothetical protein